MRSASKGVRACHRYAPCLRLVEGRVDFFISPLERLDAFASLSSSSSSSAKPFVSDPALAFTRRFVAFTAGRLAGSFVADGSQPVR